MRIAIAASCVLGLASCGTVESDDGGDADTDVDSDTDADSGSDSGSDSDSDSDSGSDTDTDTDNDTSTGSDSGSDTSSIDCAGLGGACDAACLDPLDCAVDLGGNEVCLAAERSQCTYDTDCVSSWTCLDRADGKGGFCVSGEDRKVICGCASGARFFHC